MAPHVLRFWETKLSFIRPLRRAGGRRFYRPSDIRVLQLVRRRLYEEDYTLKRLQTQPRASWLGDKAPAPDTLSATDADRRERLETALAWAVAAKGRLDGLLERSAA